MGVQRGSWGPVVRSTVVRCFVLGPQGVVVQAFRDLGGGCGVGHAGFRVVVRGCTGLRNDGFRGCLEMTAFKLES